MTHLDPKALEAARVAIRYLNHPETPWSDEQVGAVISAYLAAIPQAELLACPLCSMHLQAAADPRMSGMLEHPANAACPISACFFADTPELREAWNRRAPTPVTEDDPDEAYELGKRDGYEEAVQDIDKATGGDGEYKGSTFPGETVDVPVMRQRIIDRLSASPSPPKADGPGEVSVKPLEWNPQDADGSGEEAWLEAQTPFGPYTITYVEHHTLHYMLEPFRADLDSNYETEQAARLAAEADYKARILSALVSPSIKREA